MDKIQQPLRLKYIENITDIMSAMELCDKYGIPDEGLESVDEYVERIKIHYKAQKNGDISKQIEESMIRASEEDDRKRARLISMFDSLMKIVGSDHMSTRHQFVEDFLSKDGTSTNIVDDCKQRIADLRQKEKVILVAGQTTAGKSSFLNLLFNTKGFLPTSVLSCTSVITSMRYGEKRTATILFKDPTRKSVFLDLEGEGMNEFHNFTFIGQNRDTDHGIKEVQVTLPSALLKGGLVLADTPGIGENEFLEEYLMEYISRTEILGFIYVIFSDDGGGVQEDRLLNLLKLVISEQKKNNKAFPFDPKATIFVANRFDNIPKGDQDTVKRHIIEKLGASWPQFEESMTVFFSTKLAQRDVSAHPHYINDNYRQLLQLFSGLYFYAMERRLRSSYQWIENVLQRIRHCLKTAVKRLAMNQKDNQEQTKKHRARLTKLQNNAESDIKTLRADVIARSKELLDDIKVYLSSSVAQMRICSAWGKNEIPFINSEITNPKHWMFIKQRIDEAFYDRVCTEIEEWTEDKETVSDVERELVACIEGRLGILQGEIIESEYDMNHTRSSLSSNESETSSRSRRRVSLRPASIEIPMKLPLKLNFRINTFGKAKESKNFTKDPEKWVKGRADKLLKKLLQNTKKNKETQGSLDMLVIQLMDRPHTILNTLELKIPSIIEANMMLLDTLEELNLDQHRYAHEYERMAEEIENLKETLMNYGQGYIFVHDFKSSEIRVIEDQTSTGQSFTKTFRVKFSDLVSSSQGCRQSLMKRPSLIPQGLWSFISTGMLRRDGKEKPISIRLYTAASGITNTILEVAKLRCLLHDGYPLAEFLGIHHTDAQTPSYIYDGHYLNLHSYMSSSQDRVCQLPHILSEITCGLCYLHVKGFVHMEISTDTVTLNKQGEVKLTGACLPRSAALPLDTDRDIVPVSNFVYLPREALKSELYVSSADVYGFGLLMYEVIFKKKPFADQRNLKFRDFVDNLDTHKMLGLDQKTSSTLTQPTFDLMKACVNQDETNRPSMCDVADRLSEINGQFMLAKEQLAGPEISKKNRQSR